MHLAQINIAKIIAPLDSPVMSDFVANLNVINELAERSSGFIWRLKDESGDATSINAFNDEFLIVNMSVWGSVNDLFNFVYNTKHLEIFKRKKEWFSRMSERHMALWFIDEDNRPTVEEAKSRLEYLNVHGETPYAFTFRNRFTPDDLEAVSKIRNWSERA